MGLSRSVVRMVPVLLLGVVFGCQAPPKPAPPAPPPPASARDLSKMKMQIEGRDATARVGAVSAVRSQDTLVAVSEMSLEGIRPGDAVSFLDSAQSVVANGIVNSVDAQESLLVVRYVPTGTGRAPAKGDLAIWFMAKP